MLHRSVWRGLAALPSLLVLCLATVPARADVNSAIEIDGDLVKNGPSPTATDWCAIAGSPAPTSVIQFSGFQTDKPLPLDDTFSSGSKDDNDIPDWRWAFGQAQPKDDIINSAFALLKDPDSGNSILALMATLGGTNGAATLGFWLFKGCPTPVQTGTGTDYPFTGTHTPPNPVTGEHGDLLIVVNFPSSGSPVFAIYEWVGFGNGDTGQGVPLKKLDLTAYTGTGTLVAATNSATILPAGMCGLPYLSRGGDAFLATDSFYEVALDLTALGFGTECYSCFIGETRASNSVESALSDLIYNKFNTCKLTVTKSATFGGCPGSQAVYTLKACNEGQTTLDNVTMVDDNGTPDDTSDDFSINVGSLAPGACYTVSGIAGDGVDSVNANLVRTINADTTNTVTATATKGSLTVECDAPATLTLQVTKSAPVIACPDNAAIQCGASTDPSSTGEATATGEPAPTITHTDKTLDATEIQALIDAGTIPANCTGKDVIERTWKASNECGDATCVQYIYYVDTTAPTITVSAISGCYKTLDEAKAAVIGASSATDNCDATVTPTVTLKSSTDCGATYTVSATDLCGNPASQDVTVTVDLADPAITVNSITGCYKSLDEAMAAVVAAASATDTCDGTITPTVTQKDSTDCSATYTVSATDACGRAASQDVTVTIDLADPVITVNSITDCFTSLDGAMAAVVAAASVTDTCDGSITPTVALKDNTDCSATYTVSAADKCGRSASQDVTVTIDLRDPVLTVSTVTGCYKSLDEARAAVVAAASATDTCSGNLTPAVDLKDSTGCSATYSVTATDNCGRSTSQDVTVSIDLADPAITVSSITGCYKSLDEAMAAVVAAASATDTCDGTITPAVTLTDSTNCGATYTVSATDACGRTASQDVTVAIDLADPTISIGSITGCFKSLDEAMAAVVGAASATDTCDGSIAPTVTVKSSTDCSATYTVSATDKCGRSASQDVTVTIDLADPVITVSTISGCFKSLDDAKAAVVAAASATDICSGNLTPAIDLKDSTDCSATYTVSATDNCGRSTSQDVTVTIDLADPVITVSSITGCFRSLDEAMAAVVAAASATDACDGSITPAVSLKGSTACSATYTVSATDACGRSASQDVTVTIDLADPVLTVSTITGCFKSLDEAQAAVVAAASASDTCDQSVAPSVVLKGSTDCTATYSVTATDACGRSTSQDVTVTIDLTDPVITVNTITGCFTTLDEARAAVVAAASATDTCAGSITPSVALNTNTNCSATYTVIATDNCGRSASQDVTVTIGLIDPALTINTITGCFKTLDEARATVVAASSATDECGSILQPTVTLTSSTDCSATYTVSVANNCGRSASQDVTVTVDLADPVITVNSITGCFKSLDEAMAAVVAAASATDTCDGTITPTVTPKSTADCDATYTVSATDACGRTASQDVTVTIDLADPAITVSTITGCYKTLDEAKAAVIAAASATDTCDKSVTPSVALKDSTDCSATYTVSATDACGRSASQDVTVTIDLKDPEITVGTIAGCFKTLDDAMAAVVAAASAKDNCDATVTPSIVLKSNTDCGATYTVSATDACGRTASQDVTVTVDLTDPVITIQTISGCYKTLDEAMAAVVAASSVTDSCDGSITPAVTLKTNTDCSATYTVSATDACGRSASQDVTVPVDGTPPVVTCPPDMAAVAYNAGGTTVTYPAATATDGCGAVTLTYSKASGSTFPCGTTAVTVTATDACGNTAQCSFNVTVACILLEGCSPGFWKNHTDQWAGITTSQTLGSVFSALGLSAYGGLKSYTCLQALSFTGGPKLTDKAKILMRQAVSALLNAYSGIDYPMTPAEVVMAVNAALTTKSASAILKLANQLDFYNNLSCPLGGRAVKTVAPVLPTNRLNRLGR